MFERRYDYMNWLLEQVEAQLEGELLGEYGMKTWVPGKDTPEFQEKSVENAKVYFSLEITGKMPICSYDFREREITIDGKHLGKVSNIKTLKMLARDFERIESKLQDLFPGTPMPNIKEEASGEAPRWPDVDPCMNSPVMRKTERDGDIEIIGQAHFYRVENDRFDVYIELDAGVVDPEGRTPVFGISH
jgi:hypothetical protein